MSKIIRQPKTKTGFAYSLDFEFKDNPGSGFGFKCDQDGIVDDHSLQNEGLKNFMYCQIGKFPNGEEVKCVGVKKREWRQFIPALLHCDCGWNVTLEFFTNSCQCGRDYDRSGSILAPRSQWGEETGESMFEILNIH